MSSIGPGVYELKEADERTWYRAIYLAKVGKRYPCFALLREGQPEDRQERH